MTKVCAWCGNEFTTEKKTQIFCGPVCRKEKARLEGKWKRKIAMQEREKKENEKKKNSLSAIAERAKDAGMTYGEYVAEMEYRRA